ncbi:probable tRNA pseudouridine synthase 1 isoform X2 [Gigantopelta aegis]|nr:probable tRNA pseudouridine synthase 1 isoform X2 [Gigantopelta aegis]XP_041368586.1 probable tRNA pseudouridine synthase 1 isoform X2 [Gigantopelta aegis]
MFSSKLQELIKLSGIFPVLKPAGLTSAQLLNRIREKLYSEVGITMKYARKLALGHGGTLDKLATGVLVVGVGAGCKQLSQFLHGDKKYICTAELGTATDTFDCGGVTTETKNYDHVTKDSLTDCLKHFTGDILQLPPLYSAVKYGGERLSDITRDGRSVPTLQPRQVRVHSIQCTDFSPPFFTLAIHSGGGFYVRRLVDDLGRYLDTRAHVCELERTEQSPFTLMDCLREDEWTLHDIKRAIQLSQDHFHKQMSERYDNVKSL